MIAYKASYDQVCLGYKYETGETYTLDGPLEMCFNGFHFCINTDDVLNYYSIENNLVIFEVEPLGKVITKNDKSVTDKIKIIRIIPREEWKNLFIINKFDDKGNCIYRIYDTKFEQWQEYDKNNNCTHYKDSYGYEKWFQYDENSNLIYYKNSNDYEAWYEYKNNNMIHVKDLYGFECWYDDNGNRIKNPEI